MRTLIAYSTKGGACRECAEVLASRIPDATIYDLNDGAPDLNDFDIVIAGSGIRMGGAYRPFRKFLKENADALLAKKVAFFISNAQTEKADKIIEKNIPADLRNTAFIMRTFGGRAPFGKNKGDPDWMLTDAVEEFANVVNDAGRSAK
ncbi:MAG: flavodoxin domain-containing protein [Methanomassiliicoccaceae archaeon]|nr:flavodoxin domain-containing protein [Methanomassiliicoccaceae archaeon]